MLLLSIFAEYIEYGLLIWINNRINMASRNIGGRQHQKKMNYTSNKNVLEIETLTYAAKPAGMSPQIARKVEQIEKALGQRSQSNECVGKLCYNQYNGLYKKYMQ